MKYRVLLWNTRRTPARRGARYPGGQDDRSQERLVDTEAEVFSGVVREFTAIGGGAFTLTKHREIEVLGAAVKVTRIEEKDFISLTDIARHRDTDRSDYIIQNWMRNRNTIDFLGIWEQLNNPGFNSIEFDGIRSQAGLNSFSLTPKRWILQTGAIGVVAKTGRFGGTFAHQDIAFEFASWVSVEFKLYLIKEFQRLKEVEREQLGWDIRRNLARINYRIYTDAVGAQLVCLANMEGLNAHFIHEGIAQSERLILLNRIAIQQMRVLVEDQSTKRLEDK